MMNMTTDFKLTIHMVSSLDGFIAKKDNSVSWFETTDYYDKGVLGHTGLSLPTERVHAAD